MYPMWVMIQYTEFGEKMGYTGSVTSRANLIELINRLGLSLSDIHSFIINDQEQTSNVLQRLFDEVNKTREGSPNLKQGKRPTNKQKEIIKSAGLRADKWLVTKNLQHELHIVNRESGKPRVISI